MSTVTIYECQKRVYKTAVEKGWWEGVDINDPNVIGAKLALIHSEISEALEEVRKDGVSFYFAMDGSGKPEGVAVELSDAIIRILDLAEAMGFDIEHAMTEKMDYNDTRAYRHGGKAL